MPMPGFAPLPAQGKGPPQRGMSPMSQMRSQQSGLGLQAQPSKLANDPRMQRQILGEKLYPFVARVAPDMAGKITGMMLEMDISELLLLLESPDLLRNKVEEARRVLSR